MTTDSGASRAARSAIISKEARSVTRQVATHKVTLGNQIGVGMMGSLLFVTGPYRSSVKSVRPQSLESTLQAPQGPEMQGGIQVPGCEGLVFPRP